MMRIRTVKPDFFRHEGLFNLEKLTNLPVRLAFEGLWCVADREGRFEWRPRLLKLDILPWDDVDFNDVLNALETSGFIVGYESGGKRYGWIPKFKDHQIINSKEAKSKLPIPPELPPEFDELTEIHRNACDLLGSSPETHKKEQGEGNRKGREEEKERKGREGECEGILCDASAAPPPPDLLELWSESSGSLPQAREMTKERRKHWAARWATKPDRTYWASIIKLIADTPFCLGHNDRGWKANIDWLLKPQTHVRVLEGQYSSNPFARRKTQAEARQEMHAELYQRVMSGEA